jgi:membrane protease YdiL (CAAX protease family)
LKHQNAADIVLFVERQTDNRKADGNRDPGIFCRLNNYLLLLYAGACLLMYYSLAGLLYLGGAYLLSLSLPGIMAILFPLLILSKRFSLRFAEEYRLEAPALEMTVLALLISAGMIMPIEALSTFMEKRWPPEADYNNFLVSIKPKGTLSFAAVTLGLAVFTPAAEELLFRGFIQRIFMRNMSAALAVSLSALLFGICHFDLPTLPAATALGFVYGYLFYATGNLLYPILGHAIFNLVSVIRLHGLSEADLQVPEIEYPPTLLVVISLAVTVLAIYHLRRVRRSAQ